MRKKGPRDIPDFSRQAPRRRDERAPDPGTTKTQRTPAPQPRAKPQATSSKSGRRGQ